jgi:hypothetical protein
MKIYIGFSTPKSNLNPFAEAIKRVECRPYDHAYVRFPEPVDQEYMIFQASNMQVNLYNTIAFKDKHIALKEYELEINDAQYLILWRFIKSMLGVPYSLKEVFGILLMKVFHLSKQPFKDGTKEEFCSKLVAQVCQILGIDLGEDPEAIDPSYLDQLLGKTLTCILSPKF